MDNEYDSWEQFKDWMKNMMQAFLLWFGSLGALILIVYILAMLFRLLPESCAGGPGDYEMEHVHYER